LSVTEGVFVRIDSEVARLARATAEERQMPLRELVERALRGFISEQYEPERRAAALHAMEEALLGRLDRRLAQHLERIAGLYAREAFDLAVNLDLTKRTLAWVVKDRETILGYLEEAKATATRTLRERAVLPAEAQEAVQKAREEAKGWQGRAKALEAQVEAERARADSMAQELEQERRLRRRAEERITWAMMQFEAQRGFSKRPLSEFLAQYDREHPA